MTRILSELLEAKEPYFRQTLKRLEQAGGHNNLDIRLSVRLNNDLRTKIAELGLDPHDTTGEELYTALQVRLRNDEQRLIKALRRISAIHVSAAADLTEGIGHVLSNIVRQDYCYGVKTASLKRILKESAPKRTMKLLGYRSLDSLLKHEPLPPVVAVALKFESQAWRQHYLHALKQLTARDCDSRKMRVYVMRGDKWSRLIKPELAAADDYLITNQETTSIVLLPLATQEPDPGITVSIVSMALESMNALRARGSYLKMSQVTTDFGQRLQSAALNDPGLSFSSLQVPLSWETVLRFFHHLGEDIEAVAEPHVTIEELKAWHPIEQVLAEIDPTFSFWKRTAHLAMLDLHPVSVNLVDNALNLAHKRHYAQRIYRYAQKALWQECLMGYIKPDLLIKAIEQELQPKLALEYAQS